MDFSKFQWKNECPISINDDTLIMEPPPYTDMFCGLDGVNFLNIPFFFKEITGDFCISTKVSMDYSSIYDAAGLMAFVDEKNWIKPCFEYTDFYTTAVISVVTNGFSDDANGPNIEQDHVWLQLARKGKDFAIHYSLDGKKFYMIRFCTLPYSNNIKVGVVGQSPKGTGGKRYFEQVVLDQKTLTNLRFGE